MHSRYVRYRYILVSIYQPPTRFTLRGTRFSGFCENAPTEIPRGFKKKVEKEKGHKSHPPKKKVTGTAFYAGPLAPKKSRG